MWYRLAVLVALSGTTLGCGDDGTSSSKDLSATAGDLAGHGEMSMPPIDLLSPGGDAGGTVIGIACGTTPCAANAQFCCTADQGKNGLCGYDASTCGSALFYCDGPEDCPPADPYCCVLNGVGQCGNNACGGTIQYGFGMCHTTTDCANVGGTCCASSGGGPYKLCLPNGCT